MSLEERKEAGRSMGGFSGDRVASAGRIGARPRTRTGRAVAPGAPRPALAHRFVTPVAVAAMDVHDACDASVTKTGLDPRERPPS